ncbi:MAG: EAL domain-containing protein [Burkholderiaceae bacterium]|nr:EAL domain-containing protein [Burkholderiaceae bacterium]
MPSVLKAAPRRRAAAQPVRRRQRLPVAPSVGSKPAPAHPPVPHALYQFAIEQLPHGLSMFDGDDRLVVANRRYRLIWQLPDHLCRPGTHFADIIAASHGARLVVDELEPVTDPTQPGRRRREWQLDDGRIIEVTITRLPGGACVALHADVTEQRQAQMQVAHMARHDMLTGLCNRAQLVEQMLKLLPRTQRGEALAVLLVDLDRFKTVNDTLGHGAGDALLRQVAGRMRECVREGDTIARLGGDEFAVLQAGSHQPSAASALARRLVDVLSLPFDLAGQLAHIGASVGIAVAPFDATEVEPLLECADLALYRAKSAGRGVLRFFEPEMDACVQLRRQMEVDLRRAIDQQDFELAYQAQVALPGLALTGAEALIHWRHPTRGRISPADFVPVAEETGLIIPIGRWVLHQACRDAAGWPAPLRVAVKVSAVQFRSRSLMHDVLAALQDSGLPPQRLELEITEAVLLADTGHTLSVLHALRERGVRTSLDDFGAGYASLSHLRRFPFDKLQIDRSLIADLHRGGDARAIVEAIAGLGRGLGMTITAEGVETAGQLAALQAAGCGEVQGDLFSRPCAADDLSKLIADSAAAGRLHGGADAATAGPA